MPEIDTTRDVLFIQRNKHKTVLLHCKINYQDLKFFIKVR